MKRLISILSILAIGAFVLIVDYGFIQLEKHNEPLALVIAIAAVIGLVLWWPLWVKYGRGKL